MSTDDLFGEEVGAALSPKRRWAREQGVVTFLVEGETPPWKAASHAHTATGETEDEALANYALLAGVRLWFECDMPEKKP